MATRIRNGTLLTLPLDATTATPLFRQLYEGLRGGILDGTLARGVRLPATRGLAGELGVSRNTVLNAYEQLLAEGYLEGKVGSGTFVARTLPEEMIQVRPTAGPAPPTPLARRGLSQRGELLARISATACRSSGAPRPFRPGYPALDAFPFETWMRLVARHHRRPSRDLLTYGPPAGYAPLRSAIAAHLGPARAVHCDPGQVVVITGSHQGLDLIARILLDPGDTAWVEDPGYPSARAALQGAGVNLVPVPVDGDGLDVAAGSGRCPNARLVYVTPSHQFPLGVTMSLGRRLALLEWARRANAWVVEDDYDSEYRYAGRPLAALQGLDRDGRVIYLGTFSKALFPALRLGYLVVPPDLVDAFVAARAVTDRQTATLPQAVLADFITEGHFLRHIRRMRTLYSERQETLLRAARRELGGLLEVSPCATGLHLVGWLPEGRDDRQASAAAARAGLEAPPLSGCCVEGRARGGLLLGHANFDARQIRDAVRRLGAALRGGDSPPEPFGQNAFH
jgi:GntR family transcriptional regulator / MocR family aminotransferase